MAWAYAALLLGIAVSEFECCITANHVDLINKLKKPSRVQLKTVDQTISPEMKTEK